MKNSELNSLTMLMLRRVNGQCFDISISNTSEKLTTVSSRKIKMSLGQVRVKLTSAKLDPKSKHRVHYSKGEPTLYKFCQRYINFA